MDTSRPMTSALLVLCLPSLSRQGRRGFPYPAVALVLLLMLAHAAPSRAEARQVGSYHWTGVEQVVAIGDLHGDWAQYMAVMRAAGLVNRRGRWDGGTTHLVQTGDIPDRGPDTRRIIDHLRKLEREAQRAGGRVHMLIGNHDAMNVYGDLRYVTAGEFEAFESRNAERYQELLWERQLQRLEAADAEAFASMDLEAYRREWEERFPLGWNEHRQAWGVEGDYGKWVLSNPVVLKIDGTLFLHAGLSAKFCRASLAGITERVHAGLRNYDPRNPGIVEDELGPLWYRGLAMDAEQERDAMVTAILERYDAERMVVGHTPTGGVVWPRFGGRVILNDTGIAAYYGGHNAFLEIRPGRLVARYGERAIELPTASAARVEYLREVLALDPDNARLQSRLRRMLAAPAAPATPGAAEEPPLTPEEAQREAWLSPGNCR